MPVAPEHAAGYPHYFAWVDADETTFGPEHLRWDEYILDYSVTEKENDFCRLTITIPNPGTGLFAPDRKIWAWFAKVNPASSDGLKVFGLFRVIGIPGDLLGEKITVNFTARPLDFNEQKAAVAGGLRDLPNYDPVFITPEQRKNPDRVLDARAALWHCNPVTHEVSISNILVGEDGVVTFEGADVLYGSVVPSLETFPKSSASCDASVTWQRAMTGTVDLGTKVFNSYTANAIAQGWPKAGAGVGQGWSIDSAAVITSGMLDRPQVNFQINYQNQQKTHRDGDTMSINESFSGPQGSRYTDGITLTQGSQIVVGDPFTGTPGSSRIERTAAILGTTGAVQASLVLRYDANLHCEEHVLLTLVSDLQPVVFTEETPPTNDPEVITGVDVGLHLGDSDSDGSDGDEEIPIGDPSRPSYFTTDRGQLSIQYLILRKSAELQLAARAGRVGWESPLDSALDVTLRKSGIIRDRRLGGEALGKFISIEFNGDGGGPGQPSDFRAKLTIACCVGKDTPVAADPGEATYIEDGYIEAGYYARSGEVVLVGPGSIGYTPPVFETGSGLVFPLTRDQVVVREEVIETFEEQKAAVVAAAPPVGVFNNPMSILDLQARAQAGVDAMVAALQAHGQKYECELKPVTGDAPVEAYDVATTILSLPMQMDLAAIGL